MVQVWTVEARSRPVEKCTLRGGTRNVAALPVVECGLSFSPIKVVHQVFGIMSPSNCKHNLSRAAESMIGTEMYLNARMHIAGKILWVHRFFRQ